MKPSPANRPLPDGQGAQMPRRGPGGRKPGLRPLVPIGILLALVGVLWLTRPAAAQAVAAASWTYLQEVLLIMPGIVILMGLFEVWVPKSAIQRLMGQGSGIGGILLAIGLGTAPTGPLYIAFPIAASLSRKGASTFNLMIFLSTWAAIKVPQVMMEAKFLGLEFAMARLGLTLVAMLVMAYVGMNWHSYFGGQERYLAGTQVNHPESHF